jgi:O-6-methylguanine DNA methyltransferase
MKEGKILLSAEKRFVCGVEIYAAADADGCCSWLAFEEPAENRYFKAVFKEASCAGIFKELEEYFAGERKHFSFRIKMYGTAFQKKIWHTIAGIEYGCYISYRELAEKAGYPRAVRAAASAAASNPVSFAVPCHRVLHSGMDGSSLIKCGKYGGGAELKYRLLCLERKGRA